jgi:hypothetical protein
MKQKRNCPQCGRKFFGSAKYCGPKCRSKRYSERTTEQNRVNWQDPKYRARMSEVLRARGKDPKFQARKSEQALTQWQDPKYRARNGLPWQRQLRAQCA